MSKPKMSSRERVFTAINHQEPDQVPFVPASREIAIRYAGLTFADVWADGKKYVDAQVSLIKEFDIDVAFDIWCNVAVDEALGATIDLPVDDAPWVPSPFIKEKSDIKNLNLNYNPETDCRMPLLLDVVKGLRQKLGPEVPISSWISPPFRTACMLRGSSQLYLDMMMDPTFVFELLEALKEPCAKFGRWLLDAGADIICISNPVANQDCIRKDHYKEFAHPYTKWMFDNIKDHKKDAKTMYHTCGRWDDRFDLVAEESTDIWHVDNVDLVELKKNFGDRITIMGNVTTVEALLQGTPEDVRKESIDCINKAAKGGGFFLSAACTVPPAVPKANVKAMAEAIKTNGIYQ